MTVNPTDPGQAAERPRLDPYPTAEHLLPPPAPGSLTVAFFGTSSMLVRAGGTALMVDGFFSRPSLERMLAGPIAPEGQVVDACLRRAGVEALDGVVCVHSHYDHALDAPLVAAAHRAPLIGSASTAQLGRGHGLPEGLLRTVADGETLVFGDFDLTLVESVHSPGDLAPGPIGRPLVPPAMFTEWRTGACYSLLIRHADGTLLVHASANFVPGKLAAHRADAVYLGVGALGGQSAEFREAYWNEVVRAPGARTVLPVHWDDFTTPLLEGPLLAMPTSLDEVAPALDFVFGQGERDGVTVALPQAWTPVAPLA